MTPEPVDPKFPLFLSRKEADALLNLIDLGVKAGGLAVATNAAVLLQRIQAAAAAPAPTPFPGNDAPPGV